MLRKSIVFLLLLALCGFSAEAAQSNSSRKKSNSSRKSSSSKKKSSKRSSRRSSSRPAPVVKFPEQSFSTVIIDAGHGGNDPGGIPQNLVAEKTVALDVALRLSAALRSAGLKTVLTRRDDTFIPLPQRVAIGNSYTNAIFVSIHFNASPRRGARGVETYFSSATNPNLAARMLSKLAATTTGQSRGVKQASYYVLRKSKMRAVLVECGFLTNPEDARLARSAAYRQRLASQLCAAILEYRRQFRTN